MKADSMLVDRRYISVKINAPALRERNEALFILLDLSNFLSTSHDLKEILDGALARTLKFFYLDAGRIYLMEEDGETLRLAAFRGLDAEGLERVKITEGFTGKAARTRSFIAQHTSELDDSERVNLLDRKGFKIIICVPLVAMRNVVGVMNLAAGKIIELDQAKIDLLISVGNLIAVAANNAKLYADLSKKVKELRTQKEAIELFAHSISHDIKSPAVGIYGLTARLEKDYQSCLDEKGRLYCRQILKASEQIGGLVDKINAYIVAKDAPLSYEPVDVNEVLETLRSEISEQLVKREIKWVVPDAAPTITADKVSLLRIFRNLVGNALKHGGETLGEIKIEYRDAPKHHVFSISDDGVTLNREDSEKLFELFYRHERSRSIEGAGLGLAIVKELVERHGGRVWIDVGATKGMTFCLTVCKSLQ